MICKQCGAIDAEHYTYKGKYGPVPFSKCKKCHSEGKYTKKGTGWHKLDDEIVAQLRSDLADRRKTIKDVAKKFNMAATTLQYWIKKGLCDPPAPIDN